MLGEGVMQAEPSWKLPQLCMLIVTKPLLHTYPQWDSKKALSKGALSHLPFISIWFGIVLAYFRVRRSRLDT